MIKLIRKREVKLKEYKNDVDVICNKCGNDRFTYSGDGYIAGFLFEGYICTKCGERHLMQTERVVNDNGNNIRKIGFKQNYTRIHGSNRLLR